VYATQSVDAGEMTEVRDPNNIINSFQGKIANALITQSNGGVGTDAGIVLRGNRSIQGSNNALIVVDGVPSLNGSTANINPDDIESISVLRGASAGALYGSEAGNGVIIITTKMGDEDKVSVDINMGTVVNTAIGLPKLQNQYGQGSGGVIDASLGTSWGALMQGQEYINYKGEPDSYSPQPNNVRDFFQTGISSNNSIRIAGGNKKLQNYFSYTNVNTKGVVPSNDLKSHTVNLRLTTNVSEDFSIDAKATYFRRHIDNKLTGASNNPVIRAHQIARNIPLSMVQDFMTTENGVPISLFWPSTDDQNYQNPYWTLFGNQIEERVDRLTGYLKTTVQLTDWLKILGNLSMEKSFEREDLRVKQGVYFNPARAGGTYEVTKTQNEQHWFDIMLDGANDIGKNLAINYQVGAIYRNNTYDRDISTASGLNVANKFSLNFASSSILSSSSSQIQTQSLFGQFNLSYKNALFFNGSLRKDWSSLLPPPHSFEYYSFGSSVILSDLFTLPAPISYLKASANYAEVGNGGQFGLLASTYEYSPGAGNGYLRRSSVLPFPGLLPEIVKNTELGLESRFFNNRLHFSFTYYQSNSFNQLLNVSLPPATGFSSKYINAGNIRNRGFEMVLGATPINNEDFKWDLDFNLGMNKNKVLKLDDDLKVIYLIGGQNSSSNQIQVKEGGEFGDVTTNYWAVNEDGEYLVNNDGLPISSNQQGELGKVIGNFNPDAIMGLSNNFSFKNFSLRVLVDGRIGGIVISSLEQDRVFDGAPDFTTQYRDGGWNLGGVDLNGNPVNETITAQEFWQTVSSKRQGVGEFFTYDATNFRVREFAFGYDFPLKEDFAIKSINLSLVARNLFWIYRGSAKLDIPGLKERKMWFDPDYASGGIQSNFWGVPATRTIGLNLSLSF
jgi:TonB-linked SusC/RagA family outer membrane protein